MKQLQKTADAIKSNVITTITNYNANTLQSFDNMFRHSKVIGLIDDTDESILSNVTTVQLRKSFTPTINSSQKYSINIFKCIIQSTFKPCKWFNNILSSSGFKIDNNTTDVFFLDDDGNGNVRRYKNDNAVRSYANATQGTIDYSSSGLVEINSLNVSNIENIKERCFNGYRDYG